MGFVLKWKTIIVDFFKEPHNCEVIEALRKPKKDGGAGVEFEESAGKGQSDGPLKGKVLVDGKWIYKTKLAQVYPHSLCAVYASSASLSCRQWLLQFWRWCSNQKARPRSTLTWSWQSQILHPWPKFDNCSHLSRRILSDWALLWKTVSSSGRHFH